MNMIIVGCGMVGYSLAETLCGEGHNITVIDANEEPLARLANALDVSVVQGNGASYHVLQAAGIENCHVLIACTNQDEVNMLCCLIARKAAQCRTIARVRDPNYYSEISFIQEELGLSMAINPELSAAKACYHLVRMPFAMSLDSFAEGRVEMVTFVLPSDSPWAGSKLMDVALREKMPFLVAVLERDHQAIIPNGNTVLQAGDRISVVMDINYLRALFEDIGVHYKPIRNVMIAAGGNVGYYLARRLCEAKINVKIIEPNRQRCDELNDLLPKATIVYGNPCNETILQEEGVSETDAFCSMLGNDAENITLALYVSKYTNAKVITRVNRMDLGGIVAELPIGSVVSPKELTAEHILRYARALGAENRSSRMEAVYRLPGNSQVETMAFMVTSQSDMTDRTLMDLKLRSGVLVCAIIRDGSKVIIPSGRDCIRKGDLVIIATSLKGVNDLLDVLA